MINLFKQCFCQTTRLVLALCFALAIYGCSGSSSSTSNPVSIEQIGSSGDDPIDAPTTAADTESLQQIEPVGTAPMSDSVADSTDLSPDSAINDSVVPSVTNADVPDPMVQNNTDVTFEITVPAYQSNELQLRLSWGEFSTSLIWVGDEFWSVTANLPTNTERFLSILFLDENGDIELGSVEQQYRTGINAAEVVQVTADQFDTGRWDFDEDGASNLDELIGGTDPRVDEDSLLRIVDTQPMSLLFIANYFETLLPNDRPYMDSVIENVSENEAMVTTVDIDVNGNGNMFIDTPPFVRFNLRQGERLVQSNSVLWSGSWTFRDDFSLGQNFTSEVSVDGDTRRLVEEGSGSWIGTYSHEWETTVDVTGQLIEGSTFCKVASGTITERYTTNQDGRRTVIHTITRESVDDFWRVSRVFDLEGEVFTSEYFARELSMSLIRFGYQQQVSENDYFFCDFVDL